MVVDKNVDFDAGEIYGPDDWESCEIIHNESVNKIVSTLEG